MPATSLNPIPAPVLFPLLKALNPERAAKGRFKAPKGMKVNTADVEAFRKIAQEYFNYDQVVSRLQYKQEETTSKRT